MAEDLLMTHAATDQISLHRFQEKGVKKGYADYSFKNNASQSELGQMESNGSKPS